MRILGIDFGTSRIKAAYWDEQRNEAVMLPLGKGGRLYVPSLFHVAKDGRVRFGDEAEMMLHHDPLGVLENLKLKLDKPIQYGSNGVTAKSGALMSLLFGRLIEYAAREAKPFDGQAPEKLVLTLPSRWDYGDIYRDALEAAGYSGELVFLREPEAAAWAWIAETESAAGDVLVVLDFGGGTVDWATVQVDENGCPAMIPELPPGGITAAGAHVDEGLFDAMMERLGNEERQYALAHRSLLMDQIRQMKESQNGRSSLSGADAETLEIMLGPELFRFGRSQFEQVVKREAVDQALEGIGGYVKKAIRYAKSVGKTEIACVLAGGTRMLAGLEEQVKARLLEIGNAEGVAVSFATLGQADFATARGAVLVDYIIANEYLDEDDDDEDDDVSPQVIEDTISRGERLGFDCGPEGKKGRYIAPHKIVGILRKYRENYQDNSIALSFEVRDDVLFKAMKKCRFPSDDHVIGMINFGIFSVGGCCILFGEKGVYYNNAWMAKKPGYGRVLFGSFPEREFKSPFYSTEVSLGYDAWIYPGSADKNIVVKILNEIKSVIVSELSKS